MGERLTKQDIEKIRSEIDHRRLVLRPELIKAVQEARAQGDLSENFEYYAAKREKNQNESRIRYLERMLKTSQLVEDRSADEEIGLNNLVTIEFPEDHVTETYKLVTSIRGNSMQGRISIESPLGKAILGRHAGDEARVVLDNGSSYPVKIVSFEKNRDDGDDQIRSY